MGQHSPQEDQSERLAGVVERVTFQSPQNGFCVLRVKVPGERDLVTVVGMVGQVTPGEYLECQGRWVQNSTHGRQFQARAISVVAPSTVEGIEKYLGSGMVKGIGPHFAHTLVQAFGGWCSTSSNTSPSGSSNSKVLARHCQLNAN